ncbi:hypothetical protein BD310DRAFT_926224 [Dichomitus squalens]|uniref:Uncharacterized protein n=1 Tax=Dichomitus squalens TaxID=114155 RepID=A0A4Q9PWF8_9APHY|nr:hypothetical protein BD310DRAFT_926224 [Dichomitus squalens]
MPPKPRPVRKPSTSSGNPATAPGAVKDASAASASMPPPPDPGPPLGILVPEITALSSCLQTAVIKTGQIYGFYTDVKRLGIQQYAPKPPRSLTSALGREIVKYDQLCDAMESHLLRAITVLQRDLAREEQRIKAEEEAAAAAIPKPPSPSPMPAPTPAGSPTQTQIEPLPDGNLRPRLSGVGVNVARRQSTISLSSLSRPTAPHKLDLSASALRILPDEMIPSGLSSPVTLAPRSARAPSLPPELVMLGDPTGRSVDIDLTLDNDMDMTGPSASGSHMRSMLHVDPTAGSSADKPIELDLDMDMDVQFFADDPDAGAEGANASMFGPAPISGSDQHAHIIKPKQEEQLDLDLLGSFQSVQSTGDDMFAPFGNSTPGGIPTSSAASTSGAQKAPLGAPSPGTILADLTGTSRAGDGSGVSTSGQEGSFDFDMSTFDSNFLAGQGGGDIDMSGMDDIFNLGVNPADSSTDGGAPGGSGTS